MRVVGFLRDYGPPIGAFQMTGSFLDALAARGHDVVLYVDRPVPTASFTRGGVPIRSRYEWRRTDRADVVIAHPDQGTLAPSAARFMRAAYVGVVHNVGPKTGWYLTSHTPDLIVWNSCSTREAHGGGESGLVVRSPLPPVKAPTEIPHGQAVTLVNLTQDKGARTFYALAERLDGEAPFLGVRGGYGVQIEEPSVEVVGPFPHEAMTEKVWARTRVFLAPSADESWGRAAVEAVAHGRPVIAHPTPGLVEALGDAALFLDRDDLDAWEDETLRLLWDGPHYARSSEAALERARFLERETAADLDAMLDAIERL